jgi:hypothetical protein
MENQQNQSNEDKLNSLDGNQNSAFYNPQPVKKKRGFLLGLILSLASLFIVVVVCIIILGIWLYGQKNNSGSTDLSSHSANSQIVGDDAYVDYHYSFNSDNNYYGPNWSAASIKDSNGRSFELLNSSCRASYYTYDNDKQLSNKHWINNSGFNDIAVIVGLSNKGTFNTLKKFEESTIEIQKKDGQKVTLQGVLYGYKGDDGVTRRTRYSVKATHKSVILAIESCALKDWPKHQQDINDIRSKQELIAI